MPFNVIGAVVGIGSAIMGGISSSQSSSAQKNAIEKQYEYDKEVWKANQAKITLDYDQAVKNFNAGVRNEATLAAFKDKTNLDDYLYKLKIQNFEYQTQMRQYRKSEELYGQQLTYNSLAQQAANEAEYRRLQDATNEIAYQNQDIIIKALDTEGITAVKGQQGRSAEKGEQAQLAALGRNQAILFDSLLSARGETEAALKKIAADKYGADLSAQAARMLQPERTPDAPKPLKTPKAVMVAPRKPTVYDFGPEPIKGAMSTSSFSGWANALSGVGSSIAGLANAKVFEPRSSSQPSSQPAPAPKK
jgi:hypothetical protein